MTASVGSRPVPPAHAAPASPTSRARSTRFAREHERALRWVLGGVVFALLTVVQLLRQSGLGPWRTIWAEDAGIFYAGTPTVGHLLDPYAGYLELILRVSGFVGRAVPLGHLDWYFALTGAMVTSACVLAVWRFSSQHVSSAWLRAVLALSVVLLPAVLFEQLGNMVNSIWALTFAGWWALLYRPRSGRDAALPAAFAFLAVTSQAVALLFAPVVALLVWRRRDRPTAIVAGAFAAGTLLQLVVMAGSQATTQMGPNSFGDFPQLFGVRVLGSALLGESGTGDVWDAWGNWWAVLATIAMVGVVALLVHLARPRVRVLGLLSIGYAVLLWVGCVYGRGSSLLRIPVTGYAPAATRWSTLAIWLLLSGLCILASGIAAPRARTIVVAALVLQFAVVATVDFKGTNPRSVPPTWHDAVVAAQALCATGTVERATAFVSPPNPRFGIVLDCHRRG